MTSTDQPEIRHMIEALGVRDRWALERLLDRDVHLTALLPSRVAERTGPDAVAEEMLGWFRDVAQIAVLAAQVDLVGDRWHAAYRFALRAETAEAVVEQQAYCTVRDGLITSIRLVCSGFRPVRPGGDPAVGPRQRLEARGEGCATLTPRIAAAMRVLARGEVLAVFTDDPSAAEGIAAWARLTGHRLVATAAEPEGICYFVRHA